MFCPLVDEKPALEKSLISHEKKIPVDTDFHGYHTGSCHSGGGKNPRNVIKNDDLPSKKLNEKWDFSALQKCSCNRLYAPLGFASGSPQHACGDPRLG